MIWWWVQWLLIRNIQSILKIVYSCKLTLSNMSEYFKYWTHIEYFKTKQAGYIANLLLMAMHTLCLETERKIQFSTEELHNLSSFFIYYLKHGRSKTYRESQIEQNSQQCIPAHAFWIIYLQQLLWRRLRVYCMSLHMSAVKQYSKFGFHSSSLMLC